MENVKYVVLLYKYDVVEVGDLFVILHIYNKILSYKKKKHVLEIVIVPQLAKIRPSSVKIREHRTYGIQQQ